MSDRTPLETATDSLRKVLELVHIEPSKVEQFESEMTFVLSTYADHRVRAEVSSLESRLQAAQDKTDSDLVEAVHDWIGRFEAAGCTVSGFVVTNARAESLESRLQAVTEAHRWIPVTEREPELYQYVNTFCEKGHVSFRRWDGLPALVGMCGAPVTHWQPLPAPPTGAADAHEGRDPQQASPEVTGA